MEPKELIISFSEASAAISTKPLDFYLNERSVKKYLDDGYVVSGLVWSKENSFSICRITLRRTA